MKPDTSNTPEEIMQLETQIMRNMRLASQSEGQGDAWEAMLQLRQAEAAIIKKYGLEIESESTKLWRYACELAVEAIDGLDDAIQGKDMIDWPTYAAEAQGALRSALTASNNASLSSPPMSAQEPPEQP